MKITKVEYGETRSFDFNNINIKLEAEVQEGESYDQVLTELQYHVNNRLDDIIKKKQEGDFKKRPLVLKDEYEKIGR